MEQVVVFPDGRIVDTGSGTKASMLAECLVGHSFQSEGIMQNGTKIHAISQGQFRIQGYNKSDFENSLHQAWVLADAINLL